MFNALLMTVPLFGVTAMIWWQPNGVEGGTRYQLVKAGEAQWFTNPVKTHRN